MSYNSPITIFSGPDSQDTIFKCIAQSIEDQQNTIIYEHVEKIGIDVDKEELLRALKYDRGQYQQGHFDGFFEGMQAAAPVWKPTADGLPETKGLYLATVRRLVIDPKFGTECYPDSHEIVFFNGRDFSADIDTVDGHFVRVLAWMPLPDLYKEEDT